MTFGPIVPQALFPSKQPSNPLTNLNSLLTPVGQQKNPAADQLTPQPAFELIPRVERPTPQQSADTILSFIGGRLEALKAEGASDERLESALNAALKGFQKGLQEARDMITGLQLMTDEVNEGIDLTETLVLEGLAQLRQQFLGDEVEPDSVQAPAEIRTISPENSVSSVATSFVESYRREGSVDFQLRTNDGDVVTIRYNSEQSSYQRSGALAASVSSTGASAIAAYQAQISSSQRFSFSVEGNLDEGEREALQALLEDVSALSDEFFNGDFDQAFALAQEIQLDTSEFSALSLDLSKEVSVAVTESTVVSTVASGESDIGNSLSDNIDRLFSAQQYQLDRLQELLEQAQRFADSDLLLRDLLSNRLAQREFLA